MCIPLNLECVLVSMTSLYDLTLNRLQIRIMWHEKLNLDRIELALLALINEEYGKLHIQPLLIE